jgi:dimethylaniline monooxygenase (N-oxide forming)
MEKSIKIVENWKNDNVTFEPTRAYSIITRFMQYMDVLLKDLGLNPYRKMSQGAPCDYICEYFSYYDASDYYGVVDEFLESRKNKILPLELSLELNT